MPSQNHHTKHQSQNVTLLLSPKTNPKKLKKESHSTLIAFQISIHELWDLDMKSNFLLLPHIYCHQPFPQMILPTGSTNDHPLDKSLIPHQIAMDLYRGEKRVVRGLNPRLHHLGLLGITTKLWKILNSISFIKIYVSNNGPWNL